MLFARVQGTAHAIYVVVSPPSTFEEPAPMHSVTFRSAYRWVRRSLRQDRFRQGPFGAPGCVSSRRQGSLTLRYLLALQYCPRPAAMASWFLHKCKRQEVRPLCSSACANTPRMLTIKWLMGCLMGMVLSGLSSRDGRSVMMVGWFKAPSAGDMGQSVPAPASSTLAPPFANLIQNKLDYTAILQQVRRNWYHAKGPRAPQQQK